MKELEQVRKEIQDCDQELTNLPEIVGKTKENLLTKIHQAINLQKNIKEVPGSDANNQRQIADIDQLRLRAIDAIRNVLG